MEESSQNENTMNNDNEKYLIDVVMDNESKIQPSLQTKENINVDEGKKELRKTWKFCMFKEENGDMIIKMHYVGHFIV